MERPPVIEINAAKRILRMEGAISGGIYTGTDKVRSGYGNGDCLYFDFRHGVFAVADGTERFPWASRDILKRLSRALTEEHVPGSAADWKALINQRVYSGQKYQHKTTFSCVAVRGDAHGVSLTVAHGGDSAVMVLDAATGEVLFQTERNMVFAGRSPEIVDILEYEIGDRNVRVVICSDGFDDLVRFCVRQSFYSGMADAFVAHPVERIGERMHGMLMENAGLIEHDDIAFIAMDPLRLTGGGGRRILIGGTQPHEEKHFRKGNESGAADRWIPQEGWAGAGDLFIRSGITIQEE